MTKPSNTAIEIHIQRYEASMQHHLNNSTAQRTLCDSWLRREVGQLPTRTELEAIAKGHVPRDLTPLLTAFDIALVDSGEMGFDSEMRLKPSDRLIDWGRRAIAYDLAHKNRNSDQVFFYDWMQVRWHLKASAIAALMLKLAES